MDTVIWSIFPRVAVTMVNQWEHLYNSNTSWITNSSLLRSSCISMYFSCWCGTTRTLSMVFPPKRPEEHMSGKGWRSAEGSRAEQPGHVPESKSPAHFLRPTPHTVVESVVEGTRLHRKWKTQYSVTQVALQRLRTFNTIFKRNKFLI